MMSSGKHGSRVAPESVFVLSDTRNMLGWPDSRFSAVPADRLEDRMMFVLWRRGRNH
jgi:hypothetical protein